MLFLIFLTLNINYFPLRHSNTFFLKEVKIPLLSTKWNLHTKYVNYTGQFISPSRNSDLCGSVAGMVTQKGSMSTEGETLQVSVLPYRCSICPPLVKRHMSIL
jgi:hypothetical protein